MQRMLDSTPSQSCTDGTHLNGHECADLSKLLTTMLDVKQINIRIEMMLKDLTGRVTKLEEAIAVVRVKEEIVSPSFDGEKLFTYDFPISTVEDVYRVEEVLKSNEEYTKFVIHRCRCFVAKDGKSSVTSLLRHLMTNEVASCFSWLGAKGKAPFKDLQIVNIIKTVIRNQPMTRDMSDHEIGSYIQNWLRLAPQRFQRECPMVRDLPPPVEGQSYQTPSFNLFNS